MLYSMYMRFLLKKYRFFRKEVNIFFEVDLYGPGVGYIRIILSVYGRKLL